jgi:hypothetical protein
VRVYVLAMQERLADLARIIERRMERRSSPKDGSQWSETAREVLALLEKAREVRGNIVGKGLARLMDHLPQKLLDQSPRPKLPEPIRPVSTALTITEAPAPATELRGGGFLPSAPKLMRMPSRPTDFPEDFWPRAIVILDKAIRKFRDPKSLRGPRWR